MPTLLSFIDIAPLPLKTDRTLRTVPYVTYTLCFINIFVYLSLLGGSEYQIYEFTNQWGFVIAHPSLVTLFTHAFIHTELFHLLGNLLMLWLIGTVLESGIGSLVFLLLYLASAVAAIILYGLIGRAFLGGSVNIPLIGASGAISGVTGLAAFRYYSLRVYTIPLISTSWLPLPLPLPIVVWLPLWSYAAIFAAREIVAGFMEITDKQGAMVAHWAHIGGLLLGAVMAMVLQVAREGKREQVLEKSTRSTASAAPRERSLQELKQLLREQPNDPELIEAMAGLMMSRGDHTLSRDLYLKAIRLFLIGGQRDRAAISYLNILHTFPHTVLAPREQMTMASNLEGMGHYPEAAQAFTLVTEEYPDREEAQTALLRIAQLQHHYLGDPAAAVNLLTILIERYPDSPWRTLANERLRELTRAQVESPTEPKA